MEKISMKAPVAVSVACALAAPLVQADKLSEAYVGVAGGGYTVEVGGVEDNDRSQSLRAFAGVRLSNTMSIEGDYTRLIESDKDLFEIPTDFDGDAWSVYLRPSFPLADNFHVYGKAGWTWFDDAFVGRPEDAPAELEDDSFAWGGGFDLWLTDYLTVRGDYTRLDLDDADVELLSVGMSFVF